MTQVEQESAISGTAPTLVVRFLHVGVQLIGQLYEIHTLYNDEPVKEWDACDLHTQLTILSDSIGVGYPREIGPLSEQDQALDDLRASSHLTLEIILSRLKLILDFGPDPPLHAGELKKFWPREDVKGLEERIISLRLELGVAISSVESSVTIREALLSLDITRSEETPKDLPLLDQRREESERSSKPRIVTLFGKDATGVQNAVAYKEVDKVYTENTLFTDHETTIQDFLLEAIKFSSMTDREESVTVAHNKTFDWIFSSDEPTSLFQGWQSKNSLSDWLQNGQHKEEQRSQTGLMRHLLSQLLDQQKHLIPMVFPERWKHILSLSTRERVKASISWELPELTTALKSFLDHAGRKSNVCLFIDGLDEFAGDHQQIVEFFKDCVNSYTHVKVCLSSRPFPIFSAAFGKNPRLELHELTRRDMLHFAQDHLYSDPSISQLIIQDKQAASQLIDSIVEGANGVFLWVMLVVESLLRRGNYQSVSQIHEYLGQHPTDLDDLFTHFIFDFASRDQMLVTSRLFQLLQARQEAFYATQKQDATSTSLWDFALADQFEEIMMYVPKHVQQATEQDVIRICEVTKARLSKECAGLIVAHTSGLSTSMIRHNTPSPAQQLGCSKVSYVHRTVKDFFSLPHVRSRLLEPMLGSSFEPHISLLTSIILQFIRPLDEFYPNRQINDRWPNILLAFTHARLSANHWQSQVVLIPELDRVLCQHWASRESIEYDHWARSLFSSYERRKNLKFYDPFLSLSAKFGLATLVRERTRKDDSTLYGNGNGIPLLGHCIEMLASQRQTIYPLSNPEIIGDILRSGADPNQPYQDLNGKNQTPWLVILDYLREADRRQWILYYDTSENGISRLSVIVSLFLEHGADPNGLLVETKFDRSASALEVITAIYRKYAAPQFSQLRKVLKDKGAHEREGHDIMYQVYVKECDNFLSHDEPTSRSGALAKCYAFRVNGCSAILGYILQEIVEQIQWSDSWSIDHQQQSVTLATPATATADMRSRVLEDSLESTRRLAIISMLESWRDEKFPVYGPEGEVLLEIERCASALFGIVTYGVQLLCYVKDERGLRLWIGKRSERKQTYPGMLDSTAAGGLGAGKLPIEALICEAQEEASLSEEIVKMKVKPMSHLSYFHVRGNQAGGESGLFQPEIEYTYELELDPSIIPKPRDSEVECFRLYTIEEVLYALKWGQFKPNSAIVIVEFLIRHGILNVENEPSYSEIVSHLHRKLEFPVLIQPPY
ncbi:hypothetical protein PEX1_002060 [Penicillium expansum]|uniref:Nudix hydrolase domain-containing protein n=1 Tax=Penicillium expansum TaxID=27334 RepID=A0A0A2ITL5_PENEN|nr:hypothetical protein PEX2_040570 [Penicillium expansum]KGO45803.1 hypothetical protein PEXP_019260 [Penicillium expansum]KGO54852.1 hypothetical protein PEX1_002060 [Penicillium expansum]KGO57906.1 hypothetical protein PEX2_040570 [Penicillium expansum]